jgi:hypothetical protein
VNALGLPFRLMMTEVNYTSWPLLSSLFPTYFTGVKTSRDEAVVDTSRESLVERMENYFSADIPDPELQRLHPSLMENTKLFSAVPARRALQTIGFKPELIVPFAYRPFDNRWLYWEARELLDRPRPEYFPHVFEGNMWLAAVQQNRKKFDPPAAEKRLACIHIIERSTNMFPMLLREWTGPRELFGHDAADARRLGDHFANLSDAALAYLNTMKGVADTPLLFHHAIAILHAPEYAAENAAALRQDWPRVPLPATRADLVASAELGRRVAALLDPETPVNGITAGKLRPEFKQIAVAGRAGGGSLTGDDFAVTARWGITGQGGVTMPGPGKRPKRPFTPAEAAALGTAGVQCLGPDTLDVYLNDTAHWRNVPRRVWDYTLGGYQVLKT